MGADAMASGAETQRVGLDWDHDVDQPVSDDGDAARERIRAAFDPGLLSAAGHRLVEQLSDHIPVTASVRVRHATNELD